MKKDVKNIEEFDRINKMGNEEINTSSTEEDLLKLVNAFKK